MSIKGIKKPDTTIIRSKSRNDIYCAFSWFMGMNPNIFQHSKKTLEITC